MKVSNPASLSIKDYTYSLPTNRIAKYPLEQRDMSKLLVYQQGDISQNIFKDLPQFIDEGDCLVFNDTRVIHSRMCFQRSTGAQIEILCLEPLQPVELNEAFQQTSQCIWKAMVGNAKRVKSGERLMQCVSSVPVSSELTAEIVGKDDETYHVQFEWRSGKTFAEVLDEVGTLPIPPYLNRDTEQEDEERYQTVYAQADGSVAAPTAGLHFTQRVLDELKTQGARSLFVSLHVGAGTFKPVKSETMVAHEMHRERIHVSNFAIHGMLKALEKNRLIAVGTTSLRTIETIYWLGVKLLVGKEMSEVQLGQWEPYELSYQAVDARRALQAVLAWMNEHNFSYLTGSTQLLIAPGYQIRMADALITNFHQPQSTLLLLVAAFIGEDWRKVYDYALECDFRFLSFGDGSILFRNLAKSN
jgi:S-adenosylmethionine:tRNA ribosyltransferase-isomerase